VAVETNAAGEDKIGGFRFVRTVHPGATSVVLEVVQESTGKRFALKQLSPVRAEDPAERRLFEFEAKLGMELRHPNLIHVHEYFRDPIAPYFIMDLFPSYHLKLPIARPSVYPMPIAQLHRIMEQAAAGLAYMHDKGWVHRDVKPENILVNKSGEVRVIDYALALKPYTGLKKLFKKKAPVQGTPSYMAPEQIRGEPPTPSADIYSLGITCYELACGRPPFRGDSQNELLNKHVKDRPSPLTSYNKNITGEYNDLILKMLQKKPENRLASLHEFLSKFSRIKIYKDDADPSAGRV
jgi:eukaryotic-like serine/threonine-protein kinase